MNYEEALQSRKDNEVTKQMILSAFKKADLDVDWVCKTRLGDGWYIYHPNAMAHYVYKYTRKFIRDTESGGKLYERTKERVIVKSDFVDKYDKFMLEMVIREAKNRRD